MGKVMRRKYICQKRGLVEVTQFPVSDREEATVDAGGKPRWRSAKNLEDKRDENARQAIRQAARALNCNFDHEDYLLTLTYSDESHRRLFDGMDLEQVWEAARKQAAKAMEKVMRQARRKNLTLRYFGVTSDMDGESGEMIRIHHHVVISAPGEQLVRDAWVHGLVDSEHLYRQDDLTPLAAYLLGQVRHVPARKKYVCSRNLVKPVVMEEVLDRDPEQEIRVQPGAKVLDRTPYRAGTVVQYVRYKRRPRAQKRGGRKEGKTPGSNDKGGGFEFSNISW